MPGVLPLLRKLIDGLRRVFTVLVVSCFVFMLVAVGFQVLGRYVFGFSIGDATEAASFAQVWLGLTGVGIAMRRGTIFAIDVFPQSLSLRPARVLSVIIAGLNLFFLAVLIYGGWILFQLGFGQTSPTILIPMWIIYIMIPIGMSYFALEVVLRTIEHWDEPFRRTSLDVEVEDGS